MGPENYSFVHQNIGGWANKTDADALMEDVGSDEANQSVLIQICLFRFRKTKPVAHHPEKSEH